MLEITAIASCWSSPLLPGIFGRVLFSFLFMMIDSVFYFRQKLTWLLFSWKDKGQIASNMGWDLLPACILKVLNVFRKLLN